MIDKINTITDEIEVEIDKIDAKINGRFQIRDEINWIDVFFEQIDGRLHNRSKYQRKERK